MKVKYVLLLLISTLCYTTALSQKKITWKELTTIYRKEIYDKKNNNRKETPLFNEDGVLNKNDDNQTISLKDVEGKEVTIRGYFLDLGADAMWYMLSRFPFENCFFCTGVGPETVIELGDFQNEKSKFKTDDIVSVTGTLYLIKEDGEYIYILEDCSVNHTDY